MSFASLRKEEREPEFLTDLLGQRPNITKTGPDPTDRSRHPPVRYHAQLYPRSRISRKRDVVGAGAASSSAIVRSDTYRPFRIGMASSLLIREGRTTLRVWME